MHEDTKSRFVLPNFEYFYVILLILVRQNSQQPNAKVFPFSEVSRAHPGRFVTLKSGTI